MIRLLLSAARDAGLGSGGIVTLPGLTEEVLADDRNRVNTLCANALWGYLVQSACTSHVGTDLADRATPGSLGVWDHLFTAGSTVLEGLRDATTYLGTVADTDREHLDVRCDGDLIVLRHRSVDLEDDVAAAVGDFVVATLVQRMSEVAQRRVVPVRVGLAHRAPRGSAHRLLAERLGTSRIDYGQREDAIVILAEDGLTPAPHPRPGLTAILRDHADLLLDSARVVGDWRTMLHALVVEIMPEGSPTLPVVAAKLGMSPRTLQRRLDEAGTSWRTEVDSVRAEQVRLLGSELSQRAVATRLGYRDERSLRRARQRWANPGNRP
ncbi:AraC family transcriptional regulator ligand-binding domain-containing protein [Nocardia sp. GTS18]|uniref:AraC family transcriptional regulator ligand-binding domain-containing protein n=1 Tax=Nocardia sp. GTS18 TaxID=1778064 RepID=UPI0015EED900|nr:AraC family transcriptional regulator ligand-binding domain-containing protein [Nocardia sp. GTS18]